MGNLSKLRRFRRGRRNRFRSGLEDKIIKNLEERGIAYEYEPQTFSYEEPARSCRCRDCGSRFCLRKRKYTPDLKLKCNEGFFYIEIKGKLDARTRSRMEGFLGSTEARGIDFRFIFQRDNWITKKHISRYSDWCKKLGIKYHIGEEVPEAWVTTSTVSQPP